MAQASHIVVVFGELKRHRSNTHFNQRQAGTKGSRPKARFPLVSPCEFLVMSLDDRE